MPAVEISDETLERVMRAAHTDSPEVAVSKALEEYTKSHDQASLINHLGTFEDMDTPEEFQRMREID